MRRTLGVATAGFMAAMLLATLSARAAEPPSVLLEKGVYTEETLGDVDGAMAIYQEVVGDAQSSRALAAQAHHRLALCYLKKGERTGAVDELRLLLMRYADFPDLAADARLRLASLVAPDPASLMPPETVLYVEVGSPGRQVGTVLQMLSGTPFDLAEQQKGAAAVPGTAVGARSATPSSAPAAPADQDWASRALNPSMIQELRKVRGLAIGLQDISPGGPEATKSVAVLYPGDSDAVRGLVEMGLGMAGRPGPQLEGMSTVTLKGPGGGAIAYDRDAVIFASPASKLDWCVKQYRGETHALSLADSDPSFEGLGWDLRSESTLTVWTDPGRLLGYMASAATPGGGGVPMVFLVAQDFVAANHINAVLARFVLDERSPFFETSLNWEKGAPTPQLDLVRTPAVTTAGFAEVPESAIAIGGFRPDRASAKQIGTLGMALGLVTHRAVEPELLESIEQVNVFVLPTQEPPPADASFVQSLGPITGVCLASADPGRTMGLLGGLLGKPVASANGIDRYSLPAPQGGPRGTDMPVFVGRTTGAVIVALSERPVIAALEAARTGKSVLTGGALAGSVRDLGHSISKFLLIDASPMVRLVAESAPASAGKPSPEQLARLAGALEGTVLQAWTREDDGSMAVRVGVKGLPPTRDLVPIAEMLRSAVAVHVPVKPAKADVPYHATPIKVDGGLSDWANVPAVQWSAGNPAAGKLRLAWRDDGLYGAVTSVDASIQPNNAEPWKNDSVQLFLDKDDAKATHHTKNTVQVLFWPAADKGAGPAYIEAYGPATGMTYKGLGEAAGSGIRCAWKPTPDGYAVEFFIPAEQLKPAAMSAGVRLGLALFLRNGRVEQAASFLSADVDTTWERPDLWGTVQLVGPEPVPEGGTQ